MSFFGNLFTSIGAATTFEKHRLIFTNKNDIEFPNQDSLKKMLLTFSGQDQETRAQIGYATIIRKICHSDSNTSWVYLIKNLMILDAVVEQRLFVEEINQLELPIIWQFKELEKYYVSFYFDGLIKKYFQLIKLKAKILTKKKSLFTIERYQKQEYLLQINFEQCQWHIASTEQLFQNIFEMLEYKKYDISQFKLIQYLFLQILYKLTNCYSTQLLCITRSLNFLEEIQEKQILNFKQKVIKFNKYSQNIISFVQEFKWIKGFETINYRQFDPNKNQILEFIHQALTHKKENINQKINIEKLQADQKITILRKPRESMKQLKDPLIPRLAFVEERKSKKKVFQNYINSYSEDFPPKEIITLDMLEIQEEQQYQILNEINRFERQSSLSNFNISTNKTSESDLLNIQFRRIPVKKAKNPNIYSCLVSEWIV